MNKNFFLILSLFLSVGLINCMQDDLPEHVRGVIQAHQSGTGIMVYLSRKAQEIGRLRQEGTQDQLTAAVLKYNECVDRARMLVPINYRYLQVPGE